MSNDSKELGLKPKNGEISFLMPSTTALGALKNAKEGRQLTVKYKEVDEWEADLNKPKRYFFLGFKEATDDSGSTYFLAKLHDGEVAFVCAQTVLVQALMGTEVGQGVLITCTEITKKKGNKVPLFEVKELDINLAKKSDDE